MWQNFWEVQAHRLTDDWDGQCLASKPCDTRGLQPIPPAIQNSDDRTRPSSDFNRASKADKAFCGCGQLLETTKGLGSNETSFFLYKKEKKRKSNVWFLDLFDGSGMISSEDYL